MAAGGEAGPSVSGRELTLLTEGSIELLGRIPRSSNETFLVEVSCGDDSAHAVYKPEAGERPETHRDLARIALFDYVTNNTDRKSGHVLRGSDGRVWGIDHGLCFSASFKLRTVIWDFADDPIPDALLEVIAPLAESAPPEVAELLDDEVGAACLSTGSGAQPHRARPSTSRIPPPARSCSALPVAGWKSTAAFTRCASAQSRSVTELALRR